MVQWFIMLLAFLFAGIMLLLFGRALSYEVMDLAIGKSSNPGPTHSGTFKRIGWIAGCQVVSCLFAWAVLARGVDVIGFATVFSACFAATFSYPAFLLGSGRPWND